MEYSCRICLEEGATIPIFKDFLDEDESKHSIQEKLALCLNAELEDVVGYPVCICSCCNETLDAMVNLINKYKETCKILEESLKVVVKQEYIDYEDHNDLVYSEDENKDAFEPDNIQKQLKIEFEDGANLIKKTKPLCKKTSEKKKIKKATTNKKLSIRKTINKIARHKIKRNESLSLDREDEDYCPLRPRPCKALKKSSQPVLCETCGEKFMSHEKMKLHEKKHENLKLLTCPTCNVTLSSQLHLRRHVKRKHSDLKDFICSKCGKGFAFVGDLNYHIRGVHEKTLRKQIHKRLPCQLCDKDFITKTLLLIHERSAHTGERPAVCTVCDKGFFHEDYLKQHMRLHTGERPFECPVCGLGYAQRGNMKSHMRNHRMSELDPETLGKIKTSWYRFMKP